ncbi:hypothetical protein [Streptomyces sp. NPDC054794]
MKRPWGGLTWTSQPHVQRNLRALARGQVPLTHEGLSQLTPWRSVAYLRDLLMQSGILPPADRQLLLFQRWLAEKLPTVSNPEHRKLLELFAAWHIQRRLRTLAGRGPLTGKQIQQARNELHLAIAFLGHLAERGRALPDCTRPMSTPGMQAATPPGASPMPSSAGPCGPSTCPPSPFRTARRAIPRRSPSTSGSRCCDSS